MFKNVASQKLIVYAYDSTTGLPKTGDAANLTAYVSKDYGSVTVLGDTSATEMSSGNAAGYYLFDLTQAETNADCLLFSAKSSTSNIVVLGSPATVFTDPPSFTSLNVTQGNTLFSHDPGATLGTGTSTLTQTQVTGGAYNVQSASCVLGDARIANLDATVSSRLASGSYTSPPSAASIANTIFTTGMDSYEGTASAFSLCELVLGGLNWQIVGSNWVIKKTTGATFATRPVTTTAGVDPITEVG